MRQRIFILFTAVLAFTISRCNETSAIKCHTYFFSNPQYELVQLYITQDTIRFPLDSYTYNEIKSFNLFTVQGITYISFYDRRSQSINVFHFETRAPILRLSLRTLFNNRQLYKTSIYVHNFDSIFITNKTKLYLYDSSGSRIKSIPFLKNQTYAWPVFESNNLPFIQNSTLFAIVRPNVDYQSFSSLKKWKILYEFNLKTGQSKLHYHLPYVYQTNLYGYQFLDYNFTINNRGNFVLSFPADTLLYETNLTNQFNSFFAKSKYHISPITPVTSEVFRNDEGLKAYSMRDSYGTVYFDPHTKYYLRLAKQKITEQEFISKSRIRTQTVLIFDQNLRIIGESEFPSHISFKSLFITPEGSIYARLDHKNEYTLSFVRLEFRLNTHLNLTATEK